MCLKLKASVVWTSRWCGSFHFIPWGTPRTLVSKDHLGSFHFTSYVTSKDNGFSHSGIKISSSIPVYGQLPQSLVQGSGTSKNKSYFTFLLHQLLLLQFASQVQESSHLKIVTKEIQSLLFLQFRCKNHLGLFITWGTQKTTAAIPLGKKRKESGSFGMISLYTLGYSKENNFSSSGIRIKWEHFTLNIMAQQEHLLLRFRD